MSIREVLTPPNPVLRQEAERVRAFNSELRQLVKDMVDTMRAAPGVGLAAPQIGVPQRIIVVEFAEPSEDPEAEPEEPELYCLINPEILSESSQRSLGNEGCLSLPGYFGEVERAQSVTVRGFTEIGDQTLVQAEGWLARIFQHEIDHLNGVLFIDRANRVWKVEEEDGESAQPV